MSEMELEQYIFFYQTS